MPTNLPPQYFDAEKRYRLAKDPERKVEELEVMLAIMPRHKGTDKLRAELRRKIAKLSEEAGRKHAIGRKSFFIRREGAGQVALIGLPNVGKSQLLAAVTEASPEIAEYPFTTKEPSLGMMNFENIQIQLIDTPSAASHGSRTWLNSILRNADLVAIIVDLSMQPAEQAKATVAELDELGIRPTTSKAADITTGKRQKRMLVVGNKNDLAGASLNWATALPQYIAQLPMISVSAKTGNNLHELRRKFFEALDIIRVYTKTPGAKPDLTNPIVLRRGSTIRDAAESVHKDFQNKLKYALIWGSGKFDGQRVGREHVLQDGDIVEVHI